MKIRAIITIIILCTSLCTATENKEMNTRTFDVLPSFADTFSWLNEIDYSESLHAENPAIDHKGCFSEMGVKWPTGSLFKYNAINDKFTVRNTEENLLRFEDVLTLTKVRTSAVEIRVYFVKYALNDIEHLVRKENLCKDSLIQLWKAGKGELISSPVVITKSGQDGVAKGVTEYIYPVEFAVPKTSDKNEEKLRGNHFVKIIRSEKQMCGALLQAVPEIGLPGDKIHMLIKTAHVNKPVWKRYGDSFATDNGANSHALFDQPFFHAYKVATQIQVACGKRVLLGGGMNNEAGDKTVYVFLTATIVDLEGEPVK